MTAATISQGGRRRFVQEVLWLAVPVVLWAFAYAPLARRLQAQRRQIVQFEQEWQRASRLSARQAALEAWSQEAARQMADGDAEGSGAVGRIESAAQGCGVMVTVIQPQPSRRDGTLVASTVDVECHGAPVQIIQLLHALQASSPPMVARQVRLTSQPSSGAVLARLTLEQIAFAPDRER